jgi:hypothetical protein
MPTRNINYKRIEKKNAAERYERAFAIVIDRALASIFILQK